jgi:prophage maintenance system killer protein
MFREGTYWTKPSTKQQSRKDAASILGRYSKEIKQCEKDDDKRAVTTTCCQDLFQSHLLNDGNTRTDILLGLRKMQIENGIVPNVIKNAKIFAGFAVDEIDDEIK